MKKSLSLLSLVLASNVAFADSLTLNVSVPITIKGGNWTRTYRSAIDIGSVVGLSENPDKNFYHLYYNNQEIANLATSFKTQASGGCNGALQYKVSSHAYSFWWSAGSCSKESPLIPGPTQFALLPKQPFDTFTNKSNQDIYLFNVPLAYLGKINWVKQGTGVNYDYSAKVSYLGGGAPKASSLLSAMSNATLKPIKVAPGQPIRMQPLAAFWVLAHKTNKDATKPTYAIIKIIESSYDGNWSLSTDGTGCQSNLSADNTLTVTPTTLCNVDHGQTTPVTVESYVGLPLSVGNGNTSTGSPDFPMLLDSEDTLGFEKPLMFNGQQVATLTVPMVATTAYKCTFKVDYDYAASKYQVTSDQSQCQVTDTNLSILPPPNSDTFTNTTPITPIQLSLQPIAADALGTLKSNGTGVQLSYSPQKLLGVTSSQQQAQALGFSGVDKKPQHAFWVFHYRSSPTEYKIAGVLQTSYDADWLKKCDASINHSKDQYEFKTNDDANCLWVDKSLKAVPKLTCSDVEAIHNKAVGKTEYYDNETKKFYQFRDSLTGTPYTIPYSIGALNTAAGWGSGYFQSCKQVTGYPAAVEITTCTAGPVTRGTKDVKRGTKDVKRGTCKDERRKYSCTCDSGSEKKYYMLLQP